ncbi:hypothetical protein [Arcobacter sp. CECT 8985]|uniref:hypothetical protein n=1 Tax=Arcobacter sp. CECT 8985 TaxID=1935424 RepID=UPI00100A647E|nr:hypothetical protein [Arcobacter sp. CECT 8985]RXJ87725.1 hypothetical protein CRU93_02720 [Arcobacter sp. CECT 8985]
MSNESQVRKIPKKSKIIIAILIVIVAILYAGTTYLKDMKMKEILNSLGYKNTGSIQVINKMNVENRKTNKRGTLYKVVFDNKQTNEECIGFVHKDAEGKYYDDFDCKKSE